ncbi:hypothetical protein LdCL_270005500 [Leishmania donovani]|uniref:Uncharacterized protein n=1 Tax=Leishmania donovani TaxID=5661 RepID=A0A3Q8IDX8_LEIDO|nr:hypothetical protein LdCL_270005500 [Leishmania donovani]
MTCYSEAPLSLPPLRISSQIRSPPYHATTRPRPRCHHAACSPEGRGGQLHFFSHRGARMGGLLNSWRLDDWTATV